MPDSPEKLLDPVPSEADPEATSRFRWWRRYGVAWLLTLVFVYSLGVWNGWQGPGTTTGQTPMRIAFGQGVLIVQTNDGRLVGRGFRPPQPTLGVRYTKQPNGPYQPVTGWRPFNTWIRWNPRRYGTLWLSPAFYQGYVRIPIVWLPMLAWSWIAFQSWRRRHPKRIEERCPHCRYDTRGLPSNLCPECGGPIDG